MQEMTQAEYARHAGVSREAVRKMVATGKIPHRKDGDKKLIDPVAADHARGANIARIMVEDDDDAAPEGETASRKAERATPGLTAAKTKTEEYRGALAELELHERLGKLRSVEDFTTATERCAEVAIRALDKLPGRADELVSMVTKDGKLGARECLRRIVRDLRQVMADEFSRLASGDLVKEVEREANEFAE